MIPEDWKKNKWKNRLEKYFKEFDGKKPFEYEVPDYVPNFVFKKKNVIKNVEFEDLERRIWECRNNFITGGIIAVMGLSGIGFSFYESMKKDSNYSSLIFLISGSLVFAVFGFYFSKKNWQEYRLYKAVLEYRKD